jgi:hypothetical protein
MLDSEWNNAVHQVINAKVHLAFEEVFIIETVMAHASTLHRE